MPRQSPGGSWGVLNGSFSLPCAWCRVGPLSGPGPDRLGIVARVRRLRRPIVSAGGRSNGPPARGSARRMGRAGAQPLPARGSGRKCGVRWTVTRCRAAPFGLGGQGGTEGCGHRQGGHFSREHAGNGGRDAAKATGHVEVMAGPAGLRIGRCACLHHDRMVSASYRRAIGAVGECENRQRRDHQRHHQGQNQPEPPAGLAAATLRLILMRADGVQRWFPEMIPVTDWRWSRSALLPLSLIHVKPWPGVAPAPAPPCAPRAAVRPVTEGRLTARCCLPRLAAAIIPKRVRESCG